MNYYIGWCDYALTETTTETSSDTLCDCGDDIDDYSIPIKTASGFSIMSFVHCSSNYDSDEALLR